MTHIASRPADAPPVESAMAAYYVKRASYYERVYHKPERQSDLRAMEQWLPTPFAGRRVLEIACGTGWWTPHGARDAAAWLATDLNPETMAVAQAKAMPTRADGSPVVAFRAVDAYTLAELGGQTFDAAFAGCWWSHVPLQRLSAWLDTLHARLEPGAQVVMLDNSFVQTSSTPLSHSDEHGNTYQTRPLDDGSTHEVLKNFPSPDQAFSMLGPRARDPQWIAHEHYWVLTYRLS
jgi:demethylmenaquinone methyltransferase/2-methoxy-6-polyprenyl-1,4-benzoquinol methylase